MTTYREQIKYRGFIEPIIEAPTHEIIRISSLTESLINEDDKLKPLKLKDVIHSSQAFLSSHFTLGYVPFQTDYKIGFLNFEKYGRMHPYSLPIKKIKDVDLFYGCTRELLLINEKDLSNPTIRYRWIELSRELTHLASLAYTHEITHTQLNYHRNGVRDYNNIELLSIFLELVQALESYNNEILLRVHDAHRLKELGEIVEELNKYHSSSDEEVKDVLLEGTSYLHSTLKAYHLFFIYYYGSNSIKKEMLKRVQQIFNQELSVEDLLVLYDTTFESSQDVHKFEKYIKRG